MLDYYFKNFLRYKDPKIQYHDRNLKVKFVFL